MARRRVRQWKGRANAEALLVAGLVFALASTAASQGFRVVIEEPADDARQTRLALVELRGYAGTMGARGHDLVIALDLSDSVLADSGVDVDLDGKNGRSSPDLLAALERDPTVGPGVLQRVRERDFEDSVLAIELEAASALIERLDPRRFRVGLVVFSDAARVVAPVGSSRTELRGALRDLGRNFPRELHGTNLADAIVVARDALVADPTHPPADRDLAIVLLSDGEPTLPVFPRADRAAVDAAAVAGLMGIALHGFAIGAKGAAALPLLREFASLSGGRAEHIERPAEAIARLRRLDLARVSSVEIRNESTASDAVALRVFPDGSFDAIVPLAVGTNHIAVRARDESGREALAQRTVNREAGTPDEADERRAAELLEELKRRTVQMELWAEMEQRRRIQRRDLEIVPIPPDRDPPDGSEAP